ncbi:MAG: hypothetical protein E6767_06170 [Dysgonomonas sp.]|nr:hypothetical protein [Dysgonomonas sp.]
MKKIFLILFTLISLNSFSQADLNKIAKGITEEGKKLYQLEMAAWYGSDIFRENFNGPEQIGGYFSYMDSKTPKCLFFSREETPNVIGVISFNDIQIAETANIDFKKREFKSFEKDIYSIRQRALAEIQQDTILFKTYTNTSLNLIPIISGGEKKVYVLTGPRNPGVILFGNDYLLTFNKQNNLIKKEKLHQNLIPVEFNLDSDKTVIGAFHSHSSESSEFITPTDICTLMLYAKFAGWKSHHVISKDYVSIWNCENETLEIMNREDFDKMNENK